jgi:predicted pyridoxine 5'-phosphate oxidase superfamily flavin-nucleotide-binding protein
VNDIPDIARQFLLEQRMIVVSAAYDGAVWTTILVGEPGFIQPQDDSSIQVEAHLPPGDPLFGAFDSPLEIGMIAIEPETRRRMRINGRAQLHNDVLTVQADQVFGNCPKYIQTRRGRLVDHSPTTARSTGSALTEDQVTWIGSADTFFVGTTAPGLGTDASHRGGNPGFIDVAPGRLTWPDYIGNSMYMTLGNLELDPRAGLLFVDFERGHSLHLSGTARVDWDPGRAAQWPGAQRVVDLDITRVVQLDHRVALRWELERLSRFNPPTKDSRP